MAELAAMGFFSSIIKTITGVGRAVLGIAAPAAAVPAARQLAQAPFAAAGRVLGRIPRSVVRGGAAVGGAIALGAAFEGGSRLFDAEGNPVADCPGNARNVRRTLVQTIDRESGQVVCTEVLRGSPFIMRHDIQIAKRVIRTVGKLGKVKGISRTVKQSVTSRTKEAIENKILASITKDIC